jgi:mutator protein MutT
MSPRNDDDPAPAVGRVDVAIAIIARGGKVLICQRPEGGSFAGYWEFPGGKREPGETVVDCLKREVLEELAIHITPLRALRTVDHDYARGPIRLHPFLCAHSAGELQRLACQDAAWVEPRDLTRYQFPPANEELIREAIACLTDPPET